MIQLILQTILAIFIFYVGSYPIRLERREIFFMDDWNPDRKRIDIKTKIGFVALAGIVIFLWYFFADFSVFNPEL